MSSILHSLRRVSAVIVLAWAAWPAPALCVAPGGKPNILFVLTDDQGQSSLSCYGGRYVSTPHLDRLATEGVRFTDAYVMPQCTPTRAALLTGQHTARNRMWHVIPWYGTPHGWLREPAFREQLSRDTFTLAKGLREAGYATGMAGKWHLTTGADGDYTRLNAQAAPYYGFEYAAPAGPGSVNEGDKHVDYLTDRALEFIKAHPAQPWFFYLAHHTVHGKVTAPEPLVAKHRARGAPTSGLHNATYLAALEHLDNSIGRLMAGLDELGQREDTIVVFLSDNGGVDLVYNPKTFSEAQGAKVPTPTQLIPGVREYSSAPLRMGKGSHYEGGIRVPCLVRWPRVILPGTVSAMPIHVIDWFPTLLAVADGQAPQDHPVDGIDLTPLFRGGQLLARPLFWYMPFYELRWGATPSAVMREGDWKLIEFFGDWFDAQGRYVRGARLELYNLRDDLAERNNLAGRDPHRVKTMHATLRAWLASIPAEVPTENPNYDEPRQFLETRDKDRNQGALPLPASGRN